MSASAAMDVLAGLAVGLSAALVLRRQRRDAVGLLLAATCVAWFLGSLTWFEQGLLPSIGAHSQFLHRGLLLNAVVLAAMGEPSVRLRTNRPWVLVPAVGLIALGYLLSAVRPLALAFAPTLLLGASAIAFVLFALRDEPERGRRIALSWAAAGLGLWVCAATLLRWLPEPSREWRLYLYDVGIVLCAVATSRTRIPRRAVGERAIRIADNEATSPEQSLATVLGDPGLRLGFSDGDRYLTADGTPVDVAPGQTSTIVEVGQEGRVLITHTPGLLDDKRLLAEVAGVVRLVADQHRLSQRIDVQTADVRASRDRLRVTEDVAARQVAAEIDQRVVALVREIQKMTGRLDTQIPAATRLANDVIAELAVVTSELHPGRPPDLGLVAGLRALSALSPIPVDLSVDEIDLDRAAERAMLFVASESIANAAKHSGSDRLRIVLRPEGDVVALTIADTGLGGAYPRPGGGLESLAERMTAVGGRLDVTSEAGKGTVVTAIRYAQESATIRSFDPSHRTQSHG